MTEPDDYQTLTDTEAEMIVVGSLFTDNSLATRLSLKPDDFSLSSAARLWKIAQQVVPKGGVIAYGPLVKDIPELANGLRYAIDLAGIGKPDIPAIARRLAELGMRRRLLASASELVERLKGGTLTVEESIARFQDAAARETTRVTAVGKSRVAESVVTAIKEPLPCYSSGLYTLDKVLGGGLFAGKCYGVAARKKVGKTALAGTISHNLNRRQITHLFLAGEMSPVEIEQRNMAREFRVNSVQFLTEQRHLLLTRAAEYAVHQPNHTIYEHAPGISFDELRRVVASAKSQHGATGVILDYWQLVTGRIKGDTEEYHLRNVAQWLADECRRQKLWCLVFAQVNQDGNTRGGEGLKLAADVYFTLHREKDQDDAWLEMEESRYVRYANVGSEHHAGLILRKHGPHFVDAQDEQGLAA